MDDPVGPQPFPSDAAPCVGDIIALQQVRVVDAKTAKVTGRPGSTYCFRQWADDEWSDGELDGQGVATVDVTDVLDHDTLSLEVLAQLPDGQWRRTVLNSPSGREEPGKSEGSARIKAGTVAIGVLTAAILVAVSPFAVCLWRRRERATSHPNQSS